MNGAADSVSVRKLKMIQYVIHCVASPSTTFPPSKALNEQYAGYKNPNKSENSFIPPAAKIVAARRTTAPRKK